MKEGKKATKVKNLQFLRDTNRGAVIKELVMKKAQSRIELSERLGLSRMAISGIVNELLEQKFLEECSEETSQESHRKAGRNPVILKVSDRSINAVGIYIKRFEIHCVVSDIQGKVFYHDFDVLPSEADNDIFIRMIQRLVDRAVETNREYYLAGIGIASIGPLDIYQKRLFFPPNFYHIGDIYFEKELLDRYQFPVILDNDMNASALAEHFYGDNNQNRPLVYVGFSSGVGAGIITKGKILHGSAGFAGEIGHISINPNGPLCSCGQHGCAELYTSISNLLETTGTSTVEELEAVMEKKILPRYVEAGILECREALKTLLITIANMYDPEVIILGEIPEKLSSIYIDDMESYMNAHMFHHGFQKIELKLSSLGEETPYLGAVSLVFQKIFSGGISLSGEENTLVREEAEQTE